MAENSPTPLSASPPPPSNLPERLDLFLRTTNDGIWDWDLVSGQVYYSPRWKEMLGHSDVEIDHQFNEWESRIHPDDHPLATATLAAHLQGDSPVFEIEHRLRHKDGTYRNVRARGAALRDAAGCPVRMVGSHTDVTEQKRAESSSAETQRALATLLSNLPGMAYRCRNEPDWPMEFVSDGCFDLTGYRPDELVESQRIAYGDLILPEHREAVWEAVQAGIASNQAFQMTYPIESLTGDIKWVWEQGCAVFDGGGELLGLEGFITDVTERVQAQHLLEDRVAVRTIELRTAHDATNRQLERLTTLTSITGQLLAASDLDSVLGVVVRAASHLSDASGAMVGLIDRERAILSAVAAEGEPREYFEQFNRPTLDAAFLAGTATGRAISERRPVVVEDYAAWEQSHHLRAETVRLGVLAFVVAPLLIDGEPIGVLWVNDTKARPFPPEDVALIQALADQAALAIHHARLLVRSTDAAAIEERARLARDLHDSVTQSIYSIGMMAGAAHRQWERGLPDLPKSLLTIRQVAEDAVREMRGLLHELLPPGLEDGGLPLALARLISVLQLRSSAPIAYEGESTVRFGPETETAIYRIVQEALGNAIKHSRATEVSVTLDERADHLQVLVTDNGVGFEGDGRVAVPTAGSGGIGMHSMRERAAAAGLRLQVVSIPGHGTTVTIEAPL